MDTLKLPFYVKAAFVFIGSYAFIYALYIGQNIIVPIVYATIIAVLLNPFVNFLVNRKIHKVVAISMAVALVLVITACLVYFVSTQVYMFSDAYPQLKAKTEAVSDQAIQWISGYFNIKVEKINTWIKNTKDVAFNDAGLMVGQTLLSLGSTFFVLLLLPVYLFMILYYKSMLLEFIRKLFKSVHRNAVVEVLDGTKGIIQSYLVGLLIEFMIVAIMNSVGLFILGIDYAILLGILGALLNIIPYFGGVIGTALPMIIAFVTKDSISSPLLVLGVYILIQFIDNNYLIPSIVGSKVKINALVSIIVVLIGGALWGISGMFLSIPLTAILKVVFDHIESLKPWGFLLGNIVTLKKNPLSNLKNRIRPNHRIGEII